jgi:hypothetical protein
MTIQQTLLTTGNVNWQAGSGYSQGYSSFYSKSAAVAASGNVYTFIDINSPSSPSGCLTKYDLAGNVVFQKIISAIQPQSGAVSLCIDSSENIFITGLYRPSSTSLCGVAKYNSDGVLQWVNTYQVGLGAWGTGIAVNSSNELYVSVTSFTSTVNESYVLKINNNGTLAAQVKLSISSTDFASKSIAVDSSGSVYVTVSSFPGGTKFEGYLIKLNSSLTVQWQKNINTGSVLSVTPCSITFDSSSNVYVVATTGASYVFSLFKFDSSGALLWKYTYDLVSMFEPGSISSDTQNNVYVSSGNSRVLKIDSDGALIWCTLISTSSNYGIAAAQTGFIVVAGGIAGGGGTAMANYALKLPTGYQILGSFVTGGNTFNYSNLTGITRTTSSLVIASGSATIATASGTYTSGSLSTTNGPYTQYLTYI